MLLVADDNHKKHLQFLVENDSKVVKEFCRISMEHLRKGANTKIYQSAAQRLNVEAETVQNAIDGVIYLFSEASKMMIGELEFRDSLLLLGFKGESQEELVQYYLDNRKEIRSLLAFLNISLPHYENLEWRLEVQVASRYLRRPLTPKVLLSLDLKDQQQSSNYILQADPVSLIHITEVLDQALQEMKSQHYRRIMRSVK